MHAVSPICDRGAADPISLGACLVAGKKVGVDATLLLAQDHREALNYFAWYAGAADDRSKAAAAGKLCTALRTHMQIEEEIFYPEAREATGDEALLDRAKEEHDEARRLVDRVEAATRNNEAPDDPIRELRQVIEDHVEEEENVLFPKLRDADIDLYHLGRRLAARRADCLFRSLAPAKPGQNELKEDNMTAISPDETQPLFVVGLRDVHSAVRQGKEMVENQLDRIESYPHVRERLQAHLKDKDAQLSRVEEILDSLGESPSSVKDTMMKAGGKLATMMSAATEDEILKNSLATFGLANFEAASFESLVVMATAMGRPDDARKLQACLSEERAMSAWLAENLKGLVLMHLQYRSEGTQASH